MQPSSEAEAGETLAGYLTEHCGRVLHACKSGNGLAAVNRPNWDSARAVSLNTVESDRRTLACVTGLDASLIWPARSSAVPRVDGDPRLAVQFGAPCAGALPCRVSAACHAGGGKPGLSFVAGAAGTGCVAGWRCGLNANADSARRSPAVLSIPGCCRRRRPATAACGGRAAGLLAVQCRPERDVLAPGR